MTEKVFFDSNIYIYLYSQDPQDEVKGGIARRLLAIRAPVVSPQVLQEFVSAALRKKRLGITEEKIDLLLQLTANFPFQPLTHTLILHATALRRRYSFSHWDSTIIAAAYANGCSTLYSEDLQHGFTLDHLTIVNPF
ncbi:MAG: PIN domain-containing protein [Luteolibacter sp.]